MATGEIDGFDKLKFNQMLCNIENGNWNKAKTMWILEFLKLTHNHFNHLCIDSQSIFSNVKKHHRAYYIVHQTYSLRKFGTYL